MYIARRRLLAAVCLVSIAPLVGCGTDDGERYLGEWQLVGNSKRKLRIERNGDAFTVAIKRTLKWAPGGPDEDKFPAIIDANGQLEFNAPLGKVTAVIEDKSGHLILAGDEYERVP